MPITIIATVDPAGSRVEARTDHAQLISMDADPPMGDDSAAGPKEALLAALAGCTGMDVASLLRKKRQLATSYEIEVSGETAEAHPRVFTAITVEHRVDGAVEAEALRRSIELSATRYCPVSAMLSAIATIEHRYRLSADGNTQAALVAVTGPSGPRVI
ncbi:MAG TPA: OsmC family protein [Candidatus Limnocylindrales bacterium]|nr:OsmC family protein [Candidatus Limnocylindrales bacterium]